ncbi:MAG: glutamate--tRNA ligase family protein [Bacteroidales bacterium]|nr:glutamate--tRNA ligase family protein [Bacteroidales bacterium]
METYRGRIAPTPTGLLHLGHARTFALAAKRCRDARGTLVLRIEDIDRQRCKKEFVEAAMEDLKALRIFWDEGPDCGGKFAPYVQSKALGYFREVWARLRDGGLIYPCRRSRRDVAMATIAPHADDEEAIFPVEWRPKDENFGKDFDGPADWNWRFRVPDGEEISFRDEICGE